MINNLKNFFKVLIWPIIFIVGQFFIQYIFVACFNYNEKNNIDTNFLEYINTIEYKNKLNNYINSNAILIIIFTMLLLMPIFYKAFKKYKVKSKLELKKVIISILIGISISLIYNIIILNINIIFPFTDAFKENNIFILTNLICSGVCGPILEEFLFRGIVYNKLKEFNKQKSSALITSLIFALVHFDIANSIYAFFVSLVFIYLYEKYKSLKYPIIMHMSLNITVIFMISLIVKNYIILNISLIIISIITLLLLSKLETYNDL